MDSATKPRRVRLTLPLLVVLVGTAIGGPLLRDRLTAPPDEAAILGMASKQGILPAEEHPGLGTPIYQWDPELSAIAPVYIGSVVPSSLKKYTLVRRPHAPGLYLDIRKGGMRYWIKKRP